MIDFLLCINTALISSMIVVDTETNKAFETRACTKKGQHAASNLDREPINLTELQIIAGINFVQALNLVHIHVQLHLKHTCASRSLDM